MLRPVAVAALLAFWVLVAPASAGSTWPPGTPLSQATPDSSWGVAVAADARGGAVAVWLQRTGPECCVVVQAARREPGGAWSAPVDVSRLDRQAGAPRVGIDDAGNALIVWTEPTPEGTIVRSRDWAAGAAIGPAADRSLAGTPVTPRNASDPEVVVSPAGAAIIGWSRSNGTDPATVQVVARDRADEGLGVPETIWTGGGPPQLRITPAGTAYAAWLSGEIAQLATRAPRGEWAIEPIDVLEPIRRLRLALDPAGTVALFLSSDDSTAGVLRGDVWTPVTAAPHKVARATGFAVDTDGAFFLTAPHDVFNAPGAWLASGLMGQRFDAVPFLDPRELRRSLPALFQGPPTVIEGVLLPSRAGGVLGYWSLYPNVFVTAYRRPGGEFSPVFDPLPRKADGGGAVHMALDEQGNATAVWQQRDADGNRIYSAQLDLVAPAIGEVDVPAAVTVGQPLEVRAAVSDRVGLQSVSWDFGDGARADGATAAHVYQDVGPRTVTVTATDGAGHTSSATRTVTVQALPPAVRRVVDADGDGFEPGQDCDDGNAAIRPGAREVLGNRVDENCDGTAEPYAVVAATALLTSQFLADRTTRLLRLTVRDLAAGDTIRVRCSGRGCRKAMRHSSTVKRATRSLSLARLVKGARLRPGAKLEVRIGHPERIGRVFTFVMRSRGTGTPQVRRACLTPGSATARNC